MSQALTISDELYAHLQDTARRHGLDSVDALVSKWQAQEDELYQRQLVVARIDALRDRLQATYGQLPDSTTLMHIDRNH